jgi:hypothetical protein
VPDAKSLRSSSNARTPVRAAARRIPARAAAVGNEVGIEGVGDIDERSYVDARPGMGDAVRQRADLSCAHRDQVGEALPPRVQEAVGRVPPPHGES